MKSERAKQIMSVILIGLMLTTGLFSLVVGTTHGTILTAGTPSLQTEGEQKSVDTDSVDSGSVPRSLAPGGDKGDMLMDPVYSDMDPDMLAGSRYDLSAPSGIEDYGGIGGAHGMGYDGSNVNVAVVDTGVDFGHVDLQGTQMVEPETLNAAETLSVTPLKNTDGVVVGNFSLLGNSSVVEGTIHVYRNTEELGLGTDYTVDYASGNVTFLIPIASEDVFRAVYTYNTKYGGWPVTFDPTSMKTFLSTGSPEGTMFSDTSKAGTGPFELFHTIGVDGTDDFYGSETYSEGYDEGINNEKKKDFYLTDLSATYDSDNWYIGFPVYGTSHPDFMNVTVGLAIDTDKGLSGSMWLPDETLINTNSSHSSFVTDVAFSPDGTMIASSSMDKTVTVWNAQTGHKILTFEGHKSHSNAPFSLVWSLNGTMITSVDYTHLIMWNPITGQIYHDIEYPSGKAITDESDLYEMPKSSFIDLSPNGTWLAVGQLGEKRIYLYNLTTGLPEGRIRVANNEIYSVAFDKTGKNLAVGSDKFDGNAVDVVELNSTNIMDPSQSTSDDTSAQIKYTLNGHTGKVLSIAWNPDGTQIVSSGREGRAIIWTNLSNDSEAYQTVIDTGTNTVPCVYWMPDNSSIFVSSSDLSGRTNQTFYKYSADGLTEIYNRTQNYPVYALDYSDGRIVTAGGDTNVNVWGQGGDYQRTMLAHKADMALYLDYHVRKDKNGKWIKVVDNPRIYRWNGNTLQWDMRSMDEMGARFASHEWGIRVYNEFSIPRNKIPVTQFSMELFTKGYDNISCAQDSVPDDFHILDVNHNYKKELDDFFEPNLCWSGSEVTPLSKFLDVKVSYYEVSSDIVSKSGIYHFGFHPSFVVSKKLGGLGLLVTDSSVAGVYDRVYLDFNGDHVFDESDVNVSKANPLAVYDKDGDGYPDIDAGMIYFISSASEAENELVATGNAGDDTVEFKLSHDNLVSFPKPLVQLNGNKWLDQKITEDLTGTAGASAIKLTHRFVMDKDFEARVESLSVVNESSFSVKEGKVWYSLGHTDSLDTDYVYHDCTLYAEVDSSSLPSVPGWLSDTPAHTWVRLDNKTNYTIYQNGSIKLNESGVRILWPSSYYPYYTYLRLPEGSKIYAYYNFSGPLFVNDDYTIEGDTGVISFKAPMMCSMAADSPTRLHVTYYYHPYVIDEEKGIISLAAPLESGAALEVSYDYDGVYLPYSSSYVARHPNLKNRAAGNGDLIAFSGELLEKENEKGVGLGVVTSHGTKIASAIASQARNEWSNISSVAPSSKIMSIVDGAKSSNVEDAWYFAVNGYDGYPNTGDEASIVVNAFTYPTKTDTGFDYYSRLADYISMEYTNGSAVFVGSAGSAGFGYGTIGSPGASPSMITVGGLIDTGLYMDVSGAEQGPYPVNSESDPSNGRGPTLQGNIKPELLAVETGYVDLPPQALPYDNGNKSNQFWFSVDYSTAVVAGSVAVLMQAYMQSHGSLPDVMSTREILMSSADTRGYDVLVQGAGELNLTKAIYIATDNDAAGISVDMNLWVPGGYRGTSYDAFTNMMLPGGVSATSFSINNPGDETRSVSVSSSIYRRSLSINYSDETSTYKYNSSIEGGMGLVRGHSLMSSGIIFVINETGLYVLNRTPADQEPARSGHYNYPMGQKVMDIDSSVWSGADLIRVTAYSSMKKYSVTTVSQGTKFNYTPSLWLQGWDMGPQRYLDQAKEDLNGTSYYPVVQYANCTFPTENDFTAYNTSDFHPYPIYDTNNIVVSSGSPSLPPNVLQVETANPAEKVHNGLVVFLDGGTDEHAVDGVKWDFHIEFFSKESWTWVSINNQTADSVSVPADSSESVSLKMSVPPGTPMGTYEGSIELRTPISANRTDIITMPVMVNVGSNKGRVSFGGAGDGFLMDPTGFMGGYGFSDSEIDRSGDWRYFYVDIPDTGIYTDSTGKTLTLDLNWSNKPADLDVVIFEPGRDDFSGLNPKRYGPSGMKEAVSSESPVVYHFLTVTNESEEILATDLTTGLHIIAIRPVMMSGETSVENIDSLDLGIITHSTDLTVQTNNYYDTGTVFFSSTMPFSGLSASAVGPANSVSETDIPIPTDYQSWWNFPTWPEWLVRGSYSKVVHVEDALIFDVHIWGHSDAPDLDLGVFYDANGDGVAQPSEYVATCADWDADEEVKLTNPVDGDYIVKVLGFDTADPGHFDITISIILATGEGYKITGLDSSVPYVPGTVVPFGMVWNFPGNAAESEYMGAINVGPSDAPDLILIPVSVTLDSTAPSLAGVKPEFNSVVDVEKPTIMFSFTEENSIDPKSASLTLDGVDYTMNCKVTETSIIYTPKDDLGDGIHVVNASIADAAGNELKYSWIFTIDTSTTLGDSNTVIDVPEVGDDGFIYTNSPVYTFSGVVSAGTHFAVNGQPVEVADDGSFSVTIYLTEGTNMVSLVASDDMGKTATRDLFIVYDTTAPTFSVTPSARLTSGSGIKLTGSVQLITEIGPVALSVNGRNIPVNTDGTFEYEVLLEEGRNVLDVTARDAAGNSATTELTVTRDTTAPTLGVDPVPETTSKKQITVSGSAESGAKVYINGKQIITTAGSFSSQVALSEGTNLITVSAMDLAGNYAEYSFTVVYQPDTEVSVLTASTTAQAAHALTSTAAMLIALAAIIFLIIGFIVSRFIGGKKGGEDGGAAAVEPIAEVPVEEEVPEEEYDEYEETETEPEEVAAPEEAEEPEEAEDISDEILEEAIVEEEPESGVTRIVEVGPFDLGDAMEKGNELLAAGDTVGAMEVFDSVVENAPDEVDGYLGKARVFDATGKWGKALQMVNKALEVDPQSTEAMALKGDIFAGQGKAEMARSAYEQALEIEPGNTDIRTKLSKLD